MKFICNLFDPRYKILAYICEELESNAKCSRFFFLWGGGGYFIDVKIAHVCYIKLTTCANFLQNVKYCYEICDVLVPIIHAL